MDIQKVTKEYRMSQWTKMIKERQDSGQTVEEFCEERGISRHKYYYWLRKLRKAACEEITEATKTVDYTPAVWVQLTESEQIENSINIEIDGFHINVCINTDPELLKKTCRILRTL